MMGEDALIGMGQKQRNQTKGFNRECMEESLRPFARRHGPENFRENVVAGHYGVATDSPRGTG